MKKKNSKEILKIIDNQWANTDDLMILGACGKSKALSIKKEIREKLELENVYMPTHLIPMENAIQYFKININYLKKVSEIGLNE